MRNRILVVLSVVFLAGLVSMAIAQNSPTTSRVKTAEEKTPTWTYKGDWYGFLTCSKIQRQGNKVTPDDVKKCVADGGEYILSSGGRTDLDCQGKCEANAGQQVLIVGTMTAATYGTGPTSDEAVNGLYSGGDRPAVRFPKIKIMSVKIMPKEGSSGLDADFSSRVSDKAQK